MAQAEGHDPYNRKPVNPPYEHQPFPTVVHKADGKSKSCKTQEELDAALSQGWSRKPVVEGEEAAEVEAPKKKKGKE